MILLGRHCLGNPVWYMFMRFSASQTLEKAKNRNPHFILTLSSLENLIKFPSNFETSFNPHFQTSLNLHW